MSGTGCLEDRAKACESLMQELSAAAKRKAEPEKPSFRDEPLETQRFKRPKVPVTPILPPGNIETLPKPAAADVNAEMASDSQAKPASLGFAAAELAQQASAAGESGRQAQSVGHQWPSLGSPRVSSDRLQTQEGDREPDAAAESTAAAGAEPIEVQEVEWRPDLAAAGIPSSSGGEAGLPQAQPGQAPGASASQARYLKPPG